MGLQAQEPRDPYTALWSRLEGFRPGALADLLVERRAVRLPLMRATIHLVSARDCVRLRPLVQPVLDAELRRHRDYGPAVRRVDLEPILAFAREVLSEPRTGAELRALLAEHFPGADATALAYVCRCLLPLVQVPPRGLWNRSAQVRVATAESWLGRPPEGRPSLDVAVLRYLGAFGPATVADVSTWSRLTRLREVVERLRGRLRVFRDEHGRELFDLPAAPRPDPGVPAPVRFLPEYDNVLLSHADRSRFVGARGRFDRVTGPVKGSVLQDGLVRGVWHVEREQGDERATLVVELVERLPKRATAAVAAEGRRLVRFVAAEAETRDVKIVSVD